ncbi:MAG TPA: hypothetical protein VEO00_08185 [Actinomycetota bacterium]|nr:hypothetical protein [Actinomycetota bacterium]
MSEAPANADEFLADVLAHRGEAEAGVARRLVEWARGQRLDVDRFGKPSGKGNSWVPHVRGLGEMQYLISLWAKSGRVSVMFARLRKERPFNDDVNYAKLERQFVDLPGWTPKKGSFPDIGLGDLADEAVFARFIAGLEWALGRLRAFSS